MRTCLFRCKYFRRTASARGGCARVAEFAYKIAQAFPGRRVGRIFADEVLLSEHCIFQGRLFTQVGYAMGGDKQGDLQGFAAFLKFFEHFSEAIEESDFLPNGGPWLQSARSSFLKKNILRKTKLP